MTQSATSHLTKFQELDASIKRPHHELSQAQSQADCRLGVIEDQMLRSREANKATCQSLTMLRKEVETLAALVTNAFQNRMQRETDRDDTSTNTATSQSSVHSPNMKRQTSNHAPAEVLPSDPSTLSIPDAQYKDPRDPSRTANICTGCIEHHCTLIWNSRCPHTSYTDPQQPTFHPKHSLI